MKKHLLFVGNKFINNASLQRYIIRSIKEKLGNIEYISYFQDSDNTLFLVLDQLLKENIKLTIISTNNSAAIVGKLLCTITSDNQILKDNMLIPSQTTIHEEQSYLIEHEKAFVNVIIATENQALPQIILEDEKKLAKIHVFEENASHTKILLEPLASSFDIRLDMATIVKGWIEVTVTSRKYGNIAQFIVAAKQLLNHKLIASSNIIAFIIDKLSHAKRKLTFAESCTGGLLANIFTQESGASNIFEGSLVTYSNALKSNWLAVDDTILEKYGAVSLEVVSEMSEGALNVSYADYALAISGVAGPDGGSKDKPVGTICISVRSKESVQHEQIQFFGDRNYIQEQSAFYAIKMLLLIDKELFFKDL
ncbi:MAG: CinA family protein [Campylobacterota bacterium]|nr:CinA family protein [Campylobacterota bacterium]